MSLLTIMPSSPGSPAISVSSASSSSPVFLTSPDVFCVGTLPKLETCIELDDDDDDDYEDARPATPLPFLQESPPPTPSKTVRVFYTLSPLSPHRGAVYYCNCCHVALHWYDRWRHITSFHHGRLALAFSRSGTTTTRAFLLRQRQP